MLINFNDIVKKYGEPKGIIHIGPHLMEERDVYLQNEIENIHLDRELILKFFQR